MYRLNIRLYPTEEQKKNINLACAVNRYVYNYGLEKKIQSYAVGQKISCFDIDKELRNDMSGEHDWIRGVSKRVRQCSLARLDGSFTRFFKKQNRFPKFKKHISSESFDILCVKFRNNKIYIPKIGDIKYRGYIPNGKIKTCTVKRLSTNKFEISIVIDDGLISLPKVNFTRDCVLGIDVGIKNFCTTSDGEFIKNPKWINKKEKKLRREQRSLSRKLKGSNNRNKQRISVALVHEKIKNQRRDFQHKLSTRFVMENKAIAVEDLNIAAMFNSSGLNKSISQAGWGTFISMLDYKCNKHGKTLLKTGKFEPSSKTCSSCGFINNKLTLSDRIYECGKCGISIDRDVNAAINIKKFSIKI